MRKTFSSTKNFFNFRGVQLDLARQVENLDYIKSFIDFIKGNGFNALILYLEGRIRTKCFPYMDKNEAYSPDDMRRIVDYAAKRKIEVVPIVSTLGHAEHFLEYQQLEHLAELRNGAKGRFSNFKHVFCPSQKETYEFIEAYLSEVSSLFPSKYFHVGCDEAWDIGFCELCRKRLETETQAGIFAKHLIKCHRIITRKLKKRMLIWDDLFECYPDSLEKIPNDIVMCSWHYDKFVNKPIHHFGNKQKIDKFSIYDKLGFEYMVNPAPYSFRNAETFTDYASRYKPIGGFLTMWELRNNFPLKFYPVISYVGKLWSKGKGDSDWQDQTDATEEVTGIEDKALVSIINAALNMSCVSLTPRSHSLLRGPLNNEEYERARVVGAALAATEKHTNRNDVAEDIFVTLKGESIYYELREAFGVLLDTFATKSTKEKAICKIENSLAEIRLIKAKRKAQWNKHRKGLLPCPILWEGDTGGRGTNNTSLGLDAYFDNMISQISKLLDDLKKGNGVMSVSFFLPEPYSAQTSNFLVKYENSGKWEKVAGGVFKQYPFVEAFYTYNFLVSTNKIPVAIRIESHGYGGQGLTFLEITNKKGRFVPYAILKAEGIVENPQSLFDDDQKWCFIGEKDTRREYLLPGTEEIPHTLELALKKCETLVDPLISRGKSSSRKK